MSPLIDGGIWANNPVCVAVIEAIGVLNWSRESLKVLSIGCTTEPLKINRGRQSSLGILYWAKKLINLFMFTPSSAALGMAGLLVERDNIIRIDPVVPRGRFGLDRTKEIDSLKGLGDSQAREALPTLSEVFLNNPVESFNPCHKLGGI